MNKRIRQLAIDAGIGFTLWDDSGREMIDNYTPEERLEKFAELMVQDILDTVAQANINYCAKTTYDASITECARLEMIRVLRETYNIDYKPQVPRDTIFPVPRGR